MKTPVRSRIRTSAFLEHSNKSIANREIENEKQRLLETKKK